VYPWFLEAWKYSEAMAVGIGGEWVRLIWEELGRHPAALKAAELTKPSFTVRRRSPTPSVISFR
jgi:hypothetical protein